MYRADSVGLLGLAISPLDCARSIRQSTARRRLSLYLPSRRVLPSMSIVMPASAVIEVGYWPPLASQWPSRCCVSANHFRPRSVASLTLAGSSSAVADPDQARPRATPQTIARVFTVLLPKIASHHTPASDP